MAFPQTVFGWVAVVAIALVSTVLAFTTFFAGLKRVGPITASTLSTLEPVVTIILATFILGETMSLLQIFGSLLILIAAVTLVRSEARQQLPQAPPIAERTKGDEDRKAIPANRASRTTGTVNEM
jgi:drug/metabolite transporter (DMT)-like permease